MLEVQYTWNHSLDRGNLISPPGNDSFREDLCFNPDVFLSTRDLRDAWADRREILHDGQY